MNDSELIRMGVKSRGSAEISESHRYLNIDLDAVEKFSKVSKLVWTFYQLRESPEYNCSFSVSFLILFCLAHFRRKTSMK